MLVSPPRTDQQSSAYHTSMAESPLDPLLAFLRDHSAPCPACGYNLRGLTRPVCPECEHDLVLTVGLARPRFGWLLVALVPGMFSGIAGLLLSGLIFFVAILEGDVAPPGIVLLAIFGVGSGATALAMAHGRQRLMARPVAAQQKIAAIAWSVHLVAFLVLLIAGFW